MSWIRIFRNPEQRDQKLPDHSARLLLIRERKICLVRNGEKVQAIQDECTHSKASLSKGNPNHYGEIVCPLHGYRFDLKTGRCSESSCPDAEVFPVRQQNGETQIKLPD